MTSTTFIELKSGATEVELLGGRFVLVSAAFDERTRVGVADWVSSVRLGDDTQAQLHLNYYRQGVWSSDAFDVRKLDSTFGVAHQGDSKAQEPLIDPVTGDTSYFRVLLEPSSDGVVGFASIERISSIGADAFILSMSRTFIGTPGAIADERDRWLRDSGMVYIRALAGVRPDTGWRSLLTERTVGALFP